MEPSKFLFWGSGWSLAIRHSLRPSGHAWGMEKPFVVLDTIAGVRTGPYWPIIWRCLPPALCSSQSYDP